MSRHRSQQGAADQVDERTGVILPVTVRGALLLQPTVSARDALPPLQERRKSNQTISYCIPVVVFGAKRSKSILFKLCHCNKIIKIIVLTNC